MTQLPDVTLQTLCLHDPALPAPSEMVLRLAGGARQEGETLVLPPGGTAEFDCYFNLFNLETWASHCDLDSLRLELRGEGTLCIDLWRVAGGIAAGAGEPLTRTPLIQREIRLSTSGHRLDLTPHIPGAGLLLLRFTARSDARLCDARYIARPSQPRPKPKLALVVTTFEREAAVTETVERLLSYLAGAGAELAQTTRIFIVDNGRSLSLPPHPNLRVIPNRNLGGAGGFARGLAEAKANGFSHCIFMDDDATLHPEAILRAYGFLTLAKSPKAALAGAMISQSRPAEIWENGAVFDRSCQPLCQGTDLLNRDWVLRMELAAARPKPTGFYGGWWFFAFPVAAAVAHPFPFFVRGDDISFSLANRFDTATLNGVVAWQEDFCAKESPQTLYLDLRNHLHHHLSHPNLQIGAFGTAAVALRFILRSLALMRYESAQAQLLAWKDVMAGPNHFVQSVDLAEKRAELAALTQKERWVAAPQDPVDAPPQRHPLLAKLWKLSLNGHLLPFFGRWAGETRLPMAVRGALWPVWGHAQVSYIDAQGHRSYTLRHSKRQFFALAGQMASLALRWLITYRPLQAQYQETYPKLTSADFWQRQFSADQIRGAAE
jgi:galactofuranosylgalactofuranosylrhamnosyl-N-acetylglucosaminyl-diphospho-decaprenol beta-1,5/1,6-galactofuranosyltransferase